MQKVNVFLLTSAKIKIITNLFLCRYVLQVLGNIYAKFLEVLRSSFYFIDVCLGLTFILYFQLVFAFWSVKYTFRTKFKMANIVFL